MNSAPLDHAQIGQAKPYRWGKFQGWMMVIVGALFILAAACAFLLPASPTARAFVSGFFEGQGNSALWQRLQSREGPDLAYVGGWFAVTILLTLGSGVGLLTKRTFGIVLVLFLIIRAILTVSIGSFVFWAASIPYYYKRRHEFRTP